MLWNRLIEGILNKHQVNARHLSTNCLTWPFTQKTIRHAIHIKTKHNDTCKPVREYSFTNDLNIKYLFTAV